MEESTRTIVCSEENAGDFRQLVKAWPELSALVTGLREQQLFPGLRAMRIRLTGSPERLAKGLGAVVEEIAQEARHAH